MANYRFTLISNTEKQLVSTPNMDVINNRQCIIFNVEDDPITAIFSSLREQQPSSLFEITDIENAPKCLGCLYDRPGQEEHMDCVSGCLHDMQCNICSF